MYCAFTTDEKMMYHTCDCEHIFSFPESVRMTFENTYDAEIYGFVPCECVDIACDEQDDLYNKAEEIGTQFKLKVVRKFEWLYVYTMLGEWKFVPQNGIIKLYHKNTRHRNNQEYHLQFKKDISIRELIFYIYRHDSLSRI